MLNIVEETTLQHVEVPAVRAPGFPPRQYRWRSQCCSVDVHFCFCCSSYSRVDDDSGHDVVGRHFLMSLRDVELDAGLIGDEDIGMGVDDAELIAVVVELVVVDSVVEMPFVDVELLDALLSM